MLSIFVIILAKKFKNLDTYCTVENIKETVIRRYHKSVLFSCSNCHFSVTQTFQSNWLTLGNFSHYFRRCFLKENMTSQ